MLEDLDRFHLVIDVIDRVPALGAAAAHLRQRMVDELLRACAYTRAHGEDEPAISGWIWALVVRDLIINARSGPFPRVAARPEAGDARSAVPVAVVARVAQAASRGTCRHRQAQRIRLRSRPASTVAWCSRSRPSAPTIARDAERGRGSRERRQ